MYNKNLNIAGQVYFNSKLVNFIDFDSETESCIGVFIGNAYLLVNKIDLTN